ncbi:MAG: sensor histidine kinase [Prochloraceae cyanobacterium]
MSSQVLKRDRQIRAQVEELENILQELQSTQNQLIEQEKEYSQLLEIKVKQRTQELVSKNAQLKSTLKQLKAAQKQMIAQEKLASLGGLTAGIAHEIRNPLNFINNFAQLAVDLTREVLEEIENHKDVLDEETFSDLTEIIQDLETNVTKIEHHGHRAEKIVSSMLLHSRGGPGNWQPVNLNDLLAESINLAYHGMRAKDILFNATIETYYDYKIPELTLIPQDINRVFLNIINNACYAVNLKKKEEIGNFSPLIRVTSKNLAETVEVKIWDNGVGIPPEEIERIFEHFYTTKPTGEGTGLGLSLSYEIIVERHLGKIDVRSELGEYTEFTIAFPKKEIKNTKI